MDIYEAKLLLTIKKKMCEKELTVLLNSMNMK